MSLLRCVRLPSLRAAQRPLGVMFQSTSSGASTSTLPSDTHRSQSVSETKVAETVDSMQDFMKHLAGVDSTLENTPEVDNSQPPVAPPTAYPSPNPPAPNPISAKPETIKSPLRESNMYSLHLHATRNNTMTTLCLPNGNVVSTVSAGSCGFKKANRSSYEAGYECAVRMFRRIEEETEKELKDKNRQIHLELLLSGFGQGRDALYRALMASEGTKIRPLVKRITDKTPIKIGGTRAKKARRL